MSRRIANVVVTAEFVSQIFYPSRPGEGFRTDSGLPESATLVNHGYDFATDRFYFTFSDESFVEVHEGGSVPFFAGVQFSRIEVKSR